MVLFQRREQHLHKGLGQNSRFIKCTFIDCFKLIPEALGVTHSCASAIPGAWWKILRGPIHPHTLALLLGALGLGTRGDLSRPPSMPVAELGSKLRLSTFAASYSFHQLPGYSQKKIYIWGFFEANLQTESETKILPFLMSSLLSRG